MSRLRTLRLACDLVTRREDGLERLRRWTDEQRGVPPAFGRLGAAFERIAAATTTVRLPLAPELLLPGGRPTSAVTALVADFGLTTSVISSLPDLRGVTTVSMTVDHVDVPPATGALVATCVASSYVDGTPQHATGEVRDDTGRAVARVSGWFLPAPAEQLSADRVGLVHEPPARDLPDLLQVAYGPSFDLVARDALSNALGSLHGGIGALACSLATEAALPQMRLLTSAFTFLRPTPRAGSVTVTGTVVRQGRRTGAADATVVDGDGRLLLTARTVTGPTTAVG